ncbi:MAG: helix-turn-helix domain-containing protein [Chitinivibrionales bacterium]|nr:helix-turn-helix domain-containing protein [Chitinivibrionales bacterium]MBD3396858.1 helix-turn-helix domain-containing protein [Chitinivibrionales bacterium]
MQPLTKGMAMLPAKPYLRSAEVAELFDVNPSTISLWVKKGRLRPHRTLGGNFRFRRSDIEKLLAKKGELDQERPVEERRREPRFSFNMPVLVKLGEGAYSLTYNAVIKDISGHGLGLEMLDNNGHATQLMSESSHELTVLNLPDGLFKEVVAGRVRHVEEIGKRRIQVGVSVD